MTHSNYTRENLENFSRGQLHEVCDKLSIPRRRSKTDCINDILAAQPQLKKALPVADEQAATAQSEVDQQPANLPQVNDTHFIGGFLLRCAQINGDYAVVWDVQDAQNVVMGEIRMGWDTFWTNSMSLDTFATPQEAVVDLRQSLLAFAEEDETIAFEKVADERWEAIVNGVLVCITLEGSGYKCNLVDTVFADYKSAIKGSLLAVAKLQAQPEKPFSTRGYANDSAQDKPALEVFATIRPNIYAVYSHKPGLESNRYEVDLNAQTCTCPHYEHRHSLESFKDKHIEAVRAALLSRTAPLPMEEETCVERIYEPELELIAA